MANPLTGNPYNAALDASKNPTLTVVTGTVGTADTSGTAEIIRVGGNPATGAIYVQDLSGASGTTTVQMVSGTLNVGTVVVSSSSGGTNVNVVTGTQQTLGTVANLNNGSVNILTGTIQSSGTTTGVGVVSNLTNGSVNILTGTLQSSGTTTGVGVVSNLTNGSVNILTGTLAVSLGTVGGKAASGAAAVANPVQIAGTDAGGTIYSPLVTTGGLLAANVVTGTITTGSLTNIAMVHAGTHVHPTGTVTTIVAGTQNTLGTVGVVNNIVTGTIAAVTTVTTVSNLTNGSVNLLTGTMTSVTNLAGGTVQINPVPVPATLTFGTLGTAGGSLFATISAASGAGTKHYISGVDVVVQSGTTDVRVLAGTAIQGTGVLGAGWFGPSGGISNKFFPAFATGTNSEIVYHFVGAGTAFIRVSYWKGT